MKEVAQGLASLGRGPDTMLIHMSPREVAGLQSLALAAGGTLTVNPDTGLPEAGFLDSLLPTIIGGLTSFLIPGMGGFLGTQLGQSLLSAGAGAVTRGAVTGDWGAGSLLSGAMGGYGGLGLARGLSGLGAVTQAGTVPPATTTPPPDVGTAPLSGTAPPVDATLPKAFAPATGPVGQGAFPGSAQPNYLANPPPNLTNTLSKPTIEPGASIYDRYQPPVVPEPYVDYGNNFTNAMANNPGVRSAYDAAKAAPTWDNTKAGLSNLLGAPQGGGMDLSLSESFKAMLQGMNPIQKMAALQSGLGALGPSYRKTSGGGGRGRRNAPEWYMTTFDPETQTYAPGVWTRSVDELRQHLSPGSTYSPSMGKKRSKRYNRYGYAEGGQIDEPPPAGNKDNLNMTTTSTQPPPVDSVAAAREYFTGLLNPATPMQSGLTPYDSAANAAYIADLKARIAPKPGYTTPRYYGGTGTGGGTTPTGPNTGVVNPNDPFGGNYSYGYGDLNAFTRNQFGDSLFGYSPGAGSGAFGGIGGGAYVDPMDFGAVNFGGSSGSGYMNTYGGTSPTTSGSTNPYSSQYNFEMPSIVPNDPYGMTTSGLGKYLDAAGNILASAPDWAKAAYKYMSMLSPSLSLLNKAYDYAKQKADGATVATKSPTMESAFNQMVGTPSGLRTNSGTFTFGGTGSGSLLKIPAGEVLLEGMYAEGGAIPRYAEGGLSALRNEYAAGGTLLRGPGDGMSDDIKANIDGEQEARLADGEFVMPADVVSHFGNGSTEAGARHLYTVMDKIRRARTGRTQQAPEVNPEDFLTA